MASLFFVLLNSINKMGKENMSGKMKKKYLNTLEFFGLSEFEFSYTKLEMWLQYCPLTSFRYFVLGSKSDNSKMEFTSAHWSIYKISSFACFQKCVLGLWGKSDAHKLKALQYPGFYFAPYAKYHLSFLRVCTNARSLSIGLSGNCAADRTTKSR